MKTFTKSTAYARLNEIKEIENINVSKYIRKVAESDSVPYDVLVFINRYSPIPQLEVYNHVYENRHKNPLYKNLVNENLPVEERAIALSSLLTRTLISSKYSVRNNQSDDLQTYGQLMNVRKITEALNKYLSGDDTLLNETFIEVRNVFKQLY